MAPTKKYNLFDKVMSKHLLIRPTSFCTKPIFWGVIDLLLRKLSGIIKRQFGNPPDKNCVS